MGRVVGWDGHSMRVCVCLAHTACFGRALTLSPSTSINLGWCALLTHVCAPPFALQMIKVPKMAVPKMAAPKIGRFALYWLLFCMLCALVEPVIIYIEGATLVQEDTMENTNGRLVIDTGDNLMPSIDELRAMDSLFTTGARGGAPTVRYTYANRIQHRFTQRGGRLTLGQAMRWTVNRATPHDQLMHVYAHDTPGFEIWFEPSDDSPPAGPAATPTLGGRAPPLTARPRTALAGPVGRGGGPRGSPGSGSGSGSSTSSRSGSDSSRSSRSSRRPSPLTVTPNPNRDRSASSTTMASLSDLSVDGSAECDHIANIMGIPTIEATIQEAIRNWAVRITTTLNMDTSAGAPTLEQCIEAATENELAFAQIQEDRDRRDAEENLRAQAEGVMASQGTDPGDEYMDEEGAEAALGTAPAPGGTAPAPAAAPAVAPWNENCAAMAPYLVGFQGQEVTHSFTFNLFIQAAVQAHGPAGAVPANIMGTQFTVEQALHNLHLMLPDYLWSDFNHLVQLVTPPQVNQLLHTHGNEVHPNLELPNYLEAQAQEATLQGWHLADDFDTWLHNVLDWLSENHPHVAPIARPFPPLTAAMARYHQQMLGITSPSATEVFAGFSMMVYHQWISPPPVDEEEEEAQEWPRFLSPSPAAQNEFMESIGYRVRINTCTTWGDAW